MTEPKENQTPGAASSTSPTSTPASITPKVELKDGAILVDGKKMVAESDLIAAKRSLEGQLEKAQTAHNEAIDTAKLELSSAQQKVANLNAELTKAKEASKTGAIPDTEIARIKTELADAKTLVGTLKVESDKALDYRRALLVIQYNIPADNIANKTMKELDSFEEALKALATSRGSGPGNYAAGGGGGQPHTMTNQERAAKILADTPMRGVRAEATK
jgi:DNA repair exonuclease SbcCD ATPase subunit